MDEFEKGTNVEDLRRNYAEGIKTGDIDRIVTWAGASVGLLSKVQPAKVGHAIISSNLFDTSYKEIVEEIHEECVVRLQDVDSLLEWK